MNDSVKAFLRGLEVSSPIATVGSVIVEKIKERNKEKCLMILGPKGSGKTTLWNSLRGKSFDDEDDVEGKKGGFKISKGGMNINGFDVLTLGPLGALAKGYANSKIESVLNEDLGEDSLGSYLPLNNPFSFLDFKVGEKSVNLMPVIDYSGADSLVAASAGDIEDVLEKIDEDDYTSLWSEVVNKKKTNDFCILFCVDLLSIEEKRMEVLARLRRISDSISKVVCGDVTEKVNCMLLLTNVKEFRAKHPSVDARDVYQRVIGNSIDPKRVCFKFSSVMAVDVSDKKHVERIKDKLLKVLA